MLIPILLALQFLTAQQPAPADLATFEAGKKEFEALCAGCHGVDGAGGESAGNPSVGRRTSSFSG
jgi:mono/diheme cytochrome c family protein